MARRKLKPAKRSKTGKLRIGDDWNVITIIALSQSNPLKAVAEFVENSIDAGARKISITRGKESGENYLMVTDDGQGIPKDRDGRPDFHYVATHICDSIKRKLKQDDMEGVQGEFGIGLLSFWTLGEELSLTCASADGQTYRMTMKKGELNSEVWGSGYLEGIVDVPFLNLTPGTRSGIVFDDRFAMASDALKPLE